MSILQIVLPVFLGYVGAATQFAFGSQQAHAPEVHTNPMMNILVKGPIMVFGLALLGGVFAFGYSNRSDAPAGEGMRVDDLATVVTTALGLLAVSTNAIVAYLFSVERQPQ
jgi:hypothetical protein